MSPFANSPHLWLTSHLHRLHVQDHITKIQALVRGYLVRRRRQKQRRAQALIDDVIRGLARPREPVALVPLMQRLGLHAWAETMPTAEECLSNSEADQRRRDALWHAGISLRLTGKGQWIQELEWADYHERSRALYDSLPPPPPSPPTPEPQIPGPQTPPLSFWGRFFKHIVG